MKLKELDCPICSEKKYTVYLPATLNNEPPVFGYKWTPEVRKAYRMVRCSQCNHVRASPIPENIYKYYVDNIDDEYLANQELRRKTAQVVLSRIRKYKSSGVILDVGCATGDFLIEASEYFDAVGLELSEWARNEALKKGLNVLPCMLDDIKESDAGKYDVVTLWGVIEHLQQPSQELKIINTLLKKDGLICLWTGDVNSIYAKIFGGKWWYVMGQHIQLFSRSSLDLALRNAGFEKIFSGIYPYIMNFGYLGRSFKRYPIIGNIICYILNNKYIKDKTFPLYLSDEIFYIYKKKS